MKIKLKDYKIGELSEFYGISTDTLRLYDKKGLLMSSKNDINNYRMYTRDDFVFTDNIMRLRDLGIPMSEMKKIVSQYDLDEIASYARSTLNERKEEINALQKKYMKMKDFAKKIDDFSTNVGKITVEKSPAFIVKKVDGNFEETNHAFDKLELDTIITLCLHYPQKYFDEDMIVYMNDPKLRGELFEYSFCQEDNENVRKTKITDDDDFEIFESRLCIHFSMRCELENLIGHYAKIREYAKKHNFHLTGEVMRRTIIAQNTIGKEADFFDIWAVIDDDPI